jgi:2'-5' RNA ligase
MQNQRLFLAIPFPKAYARNLSIIQSHLSEKLSDKVEHLRSTPEENLHITLLFIGNCNESIITKITEKVKAKIQQIPVFELIPQSLTLGPPGESSSQIWLTFKDNPSFSSLQNILFTAIKDICDINSPKPIIHSTLMKFLTTNTIDSHIDVSSELEVSPLTVRSIVLFGSKLQKDGSKYTPLYSFDLKM